MWNHVRSADAGRMAVLIQDEDDRNFVVMRDKSLGPYADRPFDFTFSPDGSQWAFRVKAAGDSYRVVHSQGESPQYLESGPEIQHAMAFAIPRLRHISPATELTPRDYVYPATKTETSAYTASPYAMGAGERIRLRDRLFCVWTPFDASRR